MSFSADWLAMRRDADARARNRALQRAALDALPAGDLRILDLGAGSGANLAALSPFLPDGQVWRLVDNDAGLLATVVAPEGMVAEPVVADLAGDLAPLFRPAPDLVTASAFFDLCGQRIAERIVALTVAARAVFYTVLTYDGHESWSPAHPDDGAVLEAFHADQRRDKGLGAALGPDATGFLSDSFRASGYDVRTAPSPWRLEAPGDADLIAALAEGGAQAVAPVLGPRAARWGEARRAAGPVIVGHVDLLAVPAG